jgi:protein-arginine kinase activator protein McsA
MQKGLDKLKIVFVDTHVEVTCGVCHHTFEDFPATDDLTFPCPKCHRFFKLEVAIRPLTQDETDRHLKVGVRKANQVSFKNL